MKDITDELIAEAREAPDERPELNCCVCAKAGKKVPGPMRVLGGSFCPTHGRRFWKQVRRRAKRATTTMHVPKGKR